MSPANTDRLLPILADLLRVQTKQDHERPLVKKVADAIVARHEDDGDIITSLQEEGLLNPTTSAGCIGVSQQGKSLLRESSVKSELTDDVLIGLLKEAGAYTSGDIGRKLHDRLKKLESARRGSAITPTPTPNDAEDRDCGHEPWEHARLYNHAWAERIWRDAGRVGGLPHHLTLCVMAYPKRYDPNSQAHDNKKYTERADGLLVKLSSCFLIQDGTYLLTEECRAHLNKRRAETDIADTSSFELMVQDWMKKNPPEIATAPKDPPQEPEKTEDAENDNSSKEVGKITRELRSQMIQGCLQIMDIMIREHRWPYPMNVIPGSFIHVVASVVMGLSKTRTFDKLIGTLRTDGFVEKAGARLDFGGSLPYKILKDKTRDVFDEETARRIVRECLGTEEEKESLIRLLKTHVPSSILYPPQAGERSLTDEEKRVLAAHQRAQQKKGDGLLDTESLAVIQIIANNAVAARNALKAAGLLEQLEGTWVVSEVGLFLVADQDLLNQEEKERIDANFAPPAPTPKSGIRKPADEMPPKPKPSTPVVPPPPPPPPPPTAPTPVDPLEQLRQRLAASVETTDRFAQIQEELAQARLHAQTQQRIVEQTTSDLTRLQGELDRLQREIADKTAAKTTQDAAAREAEEKAAQLAASLSNLDISKEAEKQNRLRKAIEALEALSALDEA